MRLVTAIKILLDTVMAAVSLIMIASDSKALILMGIVVLAAVFNHVVELLDEPKR